MDKTKEYINNQFGKIAQICLNSALNNTQVFTNLIAFAFIRRIDSLIENKTEQCEKFYEENKKILSDERLSDRLKDIVDGLPFYNVSGYSLSSILRSNTENIDINLKTYIEGFSLNVKNILNDFNFPYTISVLSRQMYSLINILELLCSMDMSESNGFEYNDFIELIELLKKRFLGTNKSSSYNYTSVPVSCLMAECLLAEYFTGNSTVSVLDPVCGTGGLLIAVRNKLGLRHSKIEVNLYGQDIDFTMVTITNALLLLSGNEHSIAYWGNTLLEDRFKDKTFEYVIGDFPFTKSWKGIEAQIRYEEGFGRYGLGLPDISDSQFLFMQHMISKLKPSGGRLVTITSENALIGAGGNNIRRKIFDMDMVEAIIALPKQIYNIDNRQLYLWVITNNKVSCRKGYVQLIDGRNICNGDKGHKMIENNSVIDRIISEYYRFGNTQYSNVSSNKSFLYYKVILRNVEKRIRRIVQIPADADFINYLNNELSNYANEKFAIDFNSVNMGCSIVFDKFFIRKVKPLSIDESLETIFNISNKVTLLKSRIKTLENLPTYNTYKTIDSVFNEVPEHWIEYPISVICKVIRGYSIPRLTESGDGLPYKVLSYQNDNIVGKNVYLSYSNCNVITSKDVIIVRNGVNTGKVFPGENGVLTNSLIALRPNADIIPRFFYYLIKGHERLLKNIIKQNITQTLDIDSLMELKVYIPSLAEQKVIVRTLDRIVLVADNIISSLGNSDNAFGQYRQAIIEQAVFGQVRI